MKTVILTSDVEDSTVLEFIAEGMNWFIPQAIPGVNIVAYKPNHFPGTSSEDLTVHITEANRHVGASGYHVWVNGTALAYVSPRAAGRLEGHYLAPLWTKPVLKNGKVVTPAKLIHGAQYTPGIVAVVAHEIIEGLKDPNVQTFCPPNAKGEEILNEPCDWVFGTYLVHSIKNIPCIFPNVALPNWSDQTATSHFDLAGVLTAPFTLTAHGYGYKKSPGGLVRWIP